MDPKKLQFSWWPFVVTAVAGALLPLGFAPFAWGWLAPGIMAILFYCWQGSSFKRAVFNGYLFGLAFFTSGASWVYISMHEYGGASSVAAVILTFLFVNILAVFPAITAAITQRVAAKNRVVNQLVVFPMAWVCGEWCRSWFMTGFPWLTLGYSQLETSYAGFAPITGVFGLTFLVVFSGGLLLFAVEKSGKERLFAIGGLLLLIAGGQLLRGVSWSEPAGPVFTASLIQGNIDQQVKWQPEVRRDTLRRYMEQTRHHWDSDVVLWPETAVPAYYHQVRDPIFVPFWQEARANHTDLLFGVPVVDLETGQYYNAMVSLSGGQEGIYRKRHLVPFGEYLPLKPLSNTILDYLKIPMSDFSPGERQQALLQAAGYAFATSICYEDVFGAESLVGIKDARYLVNISNDAWFSGSIAPYQHLQMAQMRALETRRYMLRATNTGMTAIINQYGGIEQLAPPYQQAVITEEVLPLAGMTPYSQSGDWPVLTLMFVSLIGLFIKDRKTG